MGWCRVGEGRRAWVGVGYGRGGVLWGGMGWGGLGQGRVG